MKKAYTSFKQARHRSKTAVAKSSSSGSPLVPAADLLHRGEASTDSGCQPDELGSNQMAIDHLDHYHRGQASHIGVAGIAGVATASISDFGSEGRLDLKEDDFPVYIDHEPIRPTPVSTKELSIVVFVLILWAAAIALFYHQWGKLNGIGSHQLDYVHANLTIPRVGQVSNIDPNTPAATSATGAVFVPTLQPPTPHLKDVEDINEAVVVVDNALLPPPDEGLAMSPAYGGSPCLGFHPYYHPEVKGSLLASPSTGTAASNTPLAPRLAYHVNSTDCLSPYSYSDFKSDGAQTFHQQPKVVQPKWLEQPTPGVGPSRASSPCYSDHYLRVAQHPFPSGRSSSQAPFGGTSAPRRCYKGAASSSQHDLRLPNSLCLSPPVPKITSFAQSVLALHRLQDNASMHGLGSYTFSRRSPLTIDPWLAGTTSIFPTCSIPGTQHRRSLSALSKISCTADDKKKVAAIVVNAIANHGSEGKKQTDAKMAKKSGNADSCTKKTSVF